MCGISTYGKPTGWYFSVFIHSRKRDTQSLVSSSPHLSKSWKHGLASTLLWLALSLSRNMTASNVSFSPEEAVEEKSTAPRRGRGPVRPEVVKTKEKRGEGCLVCSARLQSQSLDTWINLCIL